MYKKIEALNIEITKYSYINFRSSQFLCQRAKKKPISTSIYPNLIRIERNDFKITSPSS